MIDVFLEAVADNPLQAAAVLVAILALCVTTQNVRQARRTAVANMVHTFLQQYASPDMYQDLKKLREYQRQNQAYIEKLMFICFFPKDFDDNVLALAQGHVPDGETQVGQSRRNVDYFYERAYRLYENGYLPKKALRIIADTDGKDLFRDVVRPLSMAVSVVEIHKCNRQAFYAETWPQLRWYKEFDRAIERKPITRLTRARWWIEDTWANLRKWKNTKLSSGVRNRSRHG